MSGGANTPGISAMARLIRDAAGREKDDLAVADFGEIAKDMSLVVNGFPIPIPKKDYLICRGVSGKNGAARVNAGDRVLVLWSDGDAVVVDVILEASEVL